MAVRRPMLSCH